MLDRLPTEILSSELVKFCDKSSTLNLTLTCKSLNQATTSYLYKTYKPAPTLINYDNPVFYDEDKYLSYSKDAKLYKELFFQFSQKRGNRYGQSVKVRDNYRKLVRTLQSKAESTC